MHVKTKELGPIVGGRGVHRKFLFVDPPMHTHRKVATTSTHQTGLKTGKKNAPLGAWKWTQKVNHPAIS